MDLKRKNVVTKRRTKEETEKIIEERKTLAKERPQRQGGLKRPKRFTTEE